MVMALSCTAAVATVSSFAEVFSGPFLPSLSSSLLVRKDGLRRRKCSSRMVARCGVPRGAGLHTGSRPVGKAGFGDVSRCEFRWSCGAPRAYGSGVETTELGQEGLTLEDVEDTELDGGDAGGGGGRGDENGGSGGGRGDGSGGEGGESEKPKKKSGLSMSQKLTLAYAILVGGASRRSRSPFACTLSPAVAQSVVSCNPRLPF
jgi:hypothetical protein